MFLLLFHVVRADCVAVCYWTTVTRVCWVIVCALGGDSVARGGSGGEDIH